MDGYLQALGRKCARTYFPLQGFEVCKASVTFKIDCKGNISSIAVADHPRDVHTGEATDVADRALVDAIQNLGRLPIPPSEIGCPAAVSVTFDGRAEGPMKITAAFNGQGASNDK